MKLSTNTIGVATLATMAGATLLLTSIGYAQGGAASDGYLKGLSGLLGSRAIPASDARFRPAAVAFLAGASHAGLAGKMAISRTLVKHQTNQTVIFHESCFRGFDKIVAGAEPRPLTPGEAFALKTVFERLDAGKSRDLTVTPDRMTGNLDLRNLGLSEREFKGLMDTAAKEAMAAAKEAAGG